jgi:transketolase
VLASDLTEARAAVGWEAGPFMVPQDVAEAWHAGAAQRNADAYRVWQARVDALPGKTRAFLDRLIAGDLPADLTARLVAHRRNLAQSRPSQSSNQSTADIVELLADAIPELFSGAPDLEGPTNCKRTLAAFTRDNPAGRYLHYGIREHAMGAIMNGIVAHGGLLPLGATYLVFSDYMRPALRMSALMELPVITIYSHDSIGIGRNGPTHQPVEYLAALRAMPNMAVFRPADAVETAECWELALARRHGPSSMICSRQALPPVRDDAGVENRSARGAYVLADASRKRVVTLLATGSEVALALDARVQLEAAGVPTAVVSMPCWEIFEAQSAHYRDEILPEHTLRIGIEAAVKFGWERWIGRDGAFIGMSGFGASGPADALFPHFGITVDAIVTTALERLAVSAA